MKDTFMTTPIGDLPINSEGMRKLSDTLGLVLSIRRIKNNFIPLELKDTIDLMQSNDYKKRFKAEYMQNIIRYQKLKAMLEKWDKGELNFTPTCPREIYDIQIMAMEDYITVIETRAIIEGIILNVESEDK